MTLCLMLDVDGVLVCGRPSDGLNWTHSLYDDLGIRPELLVREFFAREWDDVVTGKQELLPVLERFLVRIGSNLSAQDLTSYWFEMDSRIVPSVLEDCRMARRQGHEVYLTTNQEHLRAEYLMTQMGLNREVDGIVYSANAGAQKPSPAFYSYASEFTGRPPNEMLLVDDTQTNIDGAAKAGWRAVHWDGSTKLAEILRLSIS